MKNPNTIVSLVVLKLERTPTFFAAYRTRTESKKRSNNYQIKQKQLNIKFVTTFNIKVTLRFFQLLRYLGTQILSFTDTYVSIYDMWL